MNFYCLSLTYKLACFFFNYLVPFKLSRHLTYFCHTIIAYPFNLFMSKASGKDWNRYFTILINSLIKLLIKNLVDIRIQLQINIFTVHIIRKTINYIVLKISISTDIFFSNKMLSRERTSHTEYYYSYHYYYHSCFFFMN
jgi:hypothetical protein